MRDLTEALERVAAGAQARAALDPVALEAVAAAGARRRRAQRLRVAGVVAGVAAGVLLVAVLAGGGPHRAAPVGPIRTPSSSAAPTSADAGWPAARTVAAVPACGGPAPVVEGPEAAAVRLVLRQPDDAAFAADQQVPLMASVEADRTVGRAELPAPATFALVARDGERAGEVVGIGTAGQPPAGPQWLGATGYPQLAPVAFRACEPGASEPGGTVPAGTYDVVAVLPLARTFADGTWSGGPDPLLLASEPVPLTLGEALSTADRAGALPACGAPDFAPPASPGGLGLGITVEPGGRTVGVAVTMTGQAAFADVRWAEVSWAASRDGVVVARGEVQPPQGPGFTVLPGEASSGSALAVDLTTARDCAGSPLWPGPPVTVQVRGVLRVNLAPTQDGSPPTLLPMLSGAQWYTVDQQPVPASVPVLGQGQPRPPGILDETVAQSAPGAWTVRQEWATPETYVGLRDALVAAGLTVSEELTAPDGTPAGLPTARFSGPDGLQLVVRWNVTSGDGTFAATWRIDVP